MIILEELLRILNEENSTVIGDHDETIILYRTIFCGISLACCLFLMIVYFILCLQVKFNICIRNDNNNETNPILEREYSSDLESRENNNKNKDKKKIGLGSNFMFFLTLSNFFGSLFEFLFYFYYKNIMNDFNKEQHDGINFKNKIYYEINNYPGCKLFGFAHNFWDLFSVCWTTMLTLLFYRSTNLSNEMLYQDKKYLTIGFIFSIVSCLVFCGLPFLTNSYGFARYYCSFRYKEFNQFNNFSPENESIKSIIWRWSFVIVTGLNNLFNVFCLIKTFLFYSKKLKLIEKQNKNEYKLMLIYVWVFRIFPIVLIISRFFKGLSRVIIEKLNSSATAEKIIEGINGFLFASNGIFDSIACIFFFRGVFWCCSNNQLTHTTSEDRASAMDYLGSDLAED